MRWDAGDLAAALEVVGFAQVHVALAGHPAEQRISEEQLARWFEPAPEGSRPSYAQRLGARLSDEEITAVRALYYGQLAGRSVPWVSTLAYVTAKRL